MKKPRPSNFRYPVWRRVVDFLHFYGPASAAFIAEHYSGFKRNYAQDACKLRKAGKISSFVFDKQIIYCIKGQEPEGTDHEL